MFLFYVPTLRRKRSHHISLWLVVQKRGEKLQTTSIHCASVQSFIACFAYSTDADRFSWLCASSRSDICTKRRNVSMCVSELSNWDSERAEARVSAPRLPFCRRHFELWLTAACRRHGLCVSRPAVAFPISRAQTTRAH